MTGDKVAKGESATKRQTRSVHEKQRRCEMNTVLSEMFDLLTSTSRVSPRRDEIVAPPPKKPDKCWIIGKAVDMIRAAPARPVAHYSDFFATAAAPEVAIFEIRDLVVVNMMGDETATQAIFGVAKSRMLGRDFRTFLDFDSGVNFRVGVQKVWSSIIGRKFSTFWQENLLICFGETMKLVEERPILAALLSTTTTHEDSTTPNPANVANTTLTPSLHCDSSSSSSTTTAFLSPQSTASSSRSRKSASSRRRPVATTTTPTTSRKRLRSMNVIVETYALDATNVATASHVPALISPTPIPINPYDVLAPGYRDIWLRLQSERILLEQRVLAKERELQNLMMATYSNPT